MLVSMPLFFLLIVSGGCSRSADIPVNTERECLEVNGLMELTPEPGITHTPEPTSTPIKLVQYKGHVQHIFFHPLIAYPEKAFDNDSLSKGYNDWFITVSEFKKILDSLYEKNFILVNINDTYKTIEIDGKRTVEKKDLFLPEGKKPLIISIDDLNYYEYMILNGNVHKLILDSNGEIATFSTTPDGKELISHDNDIVPILDSFVKEHDDFSLNGAKGIIALTGYEGVLGYRTHNFDSSLYSNEKEEASKVISRLKESGWTFACHGYGHLDAGKIDYNRLERDTKRWKDEVEQLIGATEVYIYPFGSVLGYKNSKLKYLKSEGFTVFCGVGPEYTEYFSDCIFTDRRSIDGYSMYINSKRLLDLFDTSEVIDSCRPQEYW